MEEHSVSEHSVSVDIPAEFYPLMTQRKHIEFERADLQNNLFKLEYFYTQHKTFCEYHMKFTEGIYEWTNYRIFLESKKN